MKSVPFAKIEKEYSGWLNCYNDNKERGEDAVDFFLADNQWDGDAVSNREQRNQESLTFNVSIKHLRRMYSQLSEIEFSLDITPANSAVLEDVSENATFRLLLNSILLNDDALAKFKHGGSKCLEYGMSVMLVDFGFESHETRNLEPKLKLLKDPSIAFFDMTAMSPTRVDGRFCGFCRTLSAQELIDSYPSLKGVSWLHETENRVFDYWYRVYKEVEFVLLTNGVQKRMDLLTLEEEDMVVRGQHNQKVITTGKVCEIYYQRCCKNKVLEKPRKHPTTDLPMVYHHGLTIWHPKQGDITMPFCQYMKGAQQLHNYLLSQAASQAKNCTGDKYFFNKEHVKNPQDRVGATEINKRDGAFTFGGDLATIRREQAAQISPTIVELAQVVKQEIDEINGAMIDTQNAQQTVIAAQALDKVTHNMEIIHAWFEERHIEWVNQIGKLFRQMIPELYTQERTLMIKKPDGSRQAVIINQDAGTGDLINNIKDINNNFMYEIKAGPSSTMQKENTIKYLTEVYQIDPTWLGKTAHIFFRNLQTKDAGELTRIATAVGDVALIQYGQGEISLEEYQQKKQQQMQSQMQMQQQMAQFDPQVQSANAIASAEHRKASADEFNAQTKRMDVLNKAQADQDNNRIKLAQLMTGNDMQERQQELEELKAQIAQNQQMLEKLRAEQQEQQLLNPDATNASNPSDAQTSTAVY